MKYTAIKPHCSEYHDPIAFAKGALLTIGEKYVGPRRLEQLVLLHHARPERQLGSRASH